MQVNDTVRAVHTAGAIRRAFYATVLSVQPTLPEDIGTNGEPTLTLGFLDPTLLHMVGGIEFHKAFRRITTVRHVSHDEVQQAAAEYCWTDVLPNDGGIIVIASLNMDDLNEPAARPSEPEDTIGTIVYINHNNGLEVFHSENGYIVRVSSDRIETFSDLFSAQIFVDAQPTATDNPGWDHTGVTPDRIEGSPREVVEHQMFGENSEEVARARYEIHLKEQAVRDAGARMADQGLALVSVADVQAALTPQPSAADLDAVDAETKAAEETSGAVPDALSPDNVDKPIEAVMGVPEELIIETKEYTDGTTATGVAPLPDQSPAQQDAAEAPAQQ